MKSIVLALSLFAAVPAFAFGHEGPEAEIPLKQVIAKVVSGSGFVPPTVPVSTVVSIYSNGDVERTQYFASKQGVTTQLASLSPAVLKAVSAASAAVVETKIIDPSPANPGCMDAPATTYYAVQGSKEIVVAEKENCKEMQKIDESDADRVTKRALNAALALESLAR